MVITRDKAGTEGKQTVMWRDLGHGEDLLF